MKEGSGHPVLPFLDIKIINDPTGCFCRHYINPSQTCRTINYNSAHPKAVFKATLEGEIKRAFSHCSKACDLKVQQNRILEKYLENGFPKNMILKSLEKLTPRSNAGGPSPPLPLQISGKNKPDFWVSIPHYPGLFELLKKWLKQFNIGVCSTPISTIKSLCQKG